MTYDDGTLQVYTVTNTAANGAMPVETLTASGQPHRYSQENVGVTRYYQALHADQQISKLVSIPDWPDIKTGDVVKLDAETAQFIIRFIQQGYDDDNLKQTKLTLERIDNGYSIN